MSSGTMHTLGRGGDVRVMWDSNVTAEVEAARAQFETLTKPRSQGGQGYLAYRAQGRAGDRGEQIRSFDPEAERIILVAPSVGG
jgi:hypothetical protein